jgi:Protein of unknown function (DUF2752).
MQLSLSPMELPQPLTAMVRDRFAARVILTFAGVHGTLVAAGLPSLPCPLLHSVGIPCPGCGISRACIALLRGDWQEMATLHFFAPLVMVVLALLVFAAFLPDSRRSAFIDLVRRFEQHTAAGLILFIVFIAYWIFRFASDPYAYVALMRG